jgi:hypothetical protein
MKKYILLIIPFLSFSQNLSIAPQISFQSDEIKFNSIFYDSYLERPVVLFGVNLHSDLNKNIGINFSTDYGQIEATEDQYFPAYDGIAVPNADGTAIEIIGAYDEYTLTQKTKNVNLIFNLNLQFQITTILNLPDPFSFSIDGGIYGKNNLTEVELEEWGTLSSLAVPDANGNILLVQTEGVLQSRAEIKFWDIGLNLGATFSLNKLNLGAKCLIPVLVQDQQITQLSTFGTEQNYSISTPEIKPSFLFSISYLFNII